MRKVKAIFKFEVVVNVPDSKEDSKRIVMNQVNGQLNLSHHGAYDLTFEDSVVTAYPESVEDYVEQPEPQTKEPYVPDGASILAFVENYQKTYGEHPYSVELERHIRYGEPKPDAEKVIFIANSYKHKYGFDDYIGEVMTYYNLELDDNLNLVKGES